MDAQQQMQQMGQGQQQGYNGSVQFQGQVIPVQNGVAQFQGQPYYVSHDGSMVIDGQRNLLGSVQGGQFVPTDAQHQEQLRTQGHLE